MKDINDKSNIISKENITIVLKKHHYNFLHYKQEGYDVQEPLRGNGKLLRLIRYMWIKLRLPFRQIWVNKAFEAKNPYIIVFEGIGIEEFIMWFHKHYANIQIHFYVENPVKNCDTRLEDIKDKCYLWADDPMDAEKYKNIYNLRYTYSGYEKNMIRTADTIKYDAMFIGLDKGRAQQVLELKKILDDLGLKSYIRICPDNKFSPKKPYYQPTIPYKELIRIEGETKVLIDIVQKGQTMPTLRAREALANNKKLITNNCFIKKLPYYKPENIFILGEDNIDDLKVFFDTEYSEIDKTVWQSFLQENIFLQNINIANTEAQTMKIINKG